MRVPEGIAPQTCTFEFIASDNDKDTPLSLIKQVQITVLALYKPPQILKDPKPITIEEPRIKATKADPVWNLRLIFDKELIFPDRMYNFSSYNEGASYFNVTLEVN